MKDLIGEWLMTEGVIDFTNVKQIIEFQRHGDKRKFGQIALSRHILSGRELKKYETIELLSKQKLNDSKK